MSRAAVAELKQRDRRFMQFRQGVMCWGCRGLWVCESGGASRRHLRHSRCCYIAGGLPLDNSTIVAIACWLLLLLLRRHVSLKAFAN